MTLLSVNINKFALIRNSRGTDHPNLVEMAKKCIQFGAQGITLHPRPDERHAKFSDLPIISELIKSYNDIEFNIEGYPSEKFINEVNKTKPNQVTLVPDPPETLTSSFGWDCFEHKNLLESTVKNFQSNNIRVSLFVNPEIKTLEHLCDILPDRVELYTFDYAKNFASNPEESIKNYLEVVQFLNKIVPKVDLNAGHDLNLQNLDFFLKHIKTIKEVSIGHALVCDSIDFGLKQTIEKYKKIIQQNND